MKIDLKTWRPEDFRAWCDDEKVYIFPHHIDPRRWGEFWQSVSRRGWQAGELTPHKAIGGRYFPKYFWKWKAQLTGEPCQNRERPHFFGGAVEHRGERLRLRKEIFEMSNGGK